MSWIRVKSPSGTDMLVDLENVVQMKRHPRGTQLVLAQIVPNKLGKAAPRTVLVRDKFEEIEKKIAPRKAGLLG